MADLFISYSRKDQPFVRRLSDALVARGRETWVDWEGIAPSAKWMGGDPFGYRRRGHVRVRHLPRLGGVERLPAGAGPRRGERQADRPAAAPRGDGAPAGVRGVDQLDLAAGGGRLRGRGDHADHGARHRPRTRSNAHPAPGPGEGMGRAAAGREPATAGKRPDGGRVVAGGSGREGARPDAAARAVRPGQPAGRIAPPAGDRRRRVGRAAGHGGAGRAGVDPAGAGRPAAEGGAGRDADRNPTAAGGAVGRPRRRKPSTSSGPSRTWRSCWRGRPR